MKTSQGERIEYQQKLVRERFSYELPDTDFEIKSIVVIAATPIVLSH